MVHAGTHFAMSILLTLFRLEEIAIHEVTDFANYLHCGENAAVNGLQNAFQVTKKLIICTGNRDTGTGCVVKYPVDLAVERI